MCCNWQWRITATAGAQTLDIVISLTHWNTSNATNSRRKAKCQEKVERKTTDSDIKKVITGNTVSAAKHTKIFGKQNANSVNAQQVLDL